MDWDARANYALLSIGNSEAEINSSDFSCILFRLGNIQVRTSFGLGFNLLAVRVLLFLIMLVTVILCRADHFSKQDHNPSSMGYHVGDQ